MSNPIIVIDNTIKIHKWKWWHTYQLINRNIFLESLSQIRGALSTEIVSRKIKIFDIQVTLKKKKKKKKKKKEEDKVL